MRAGAAGVARRGGARVRDWEETPAVKKLERVWRREGESRSRSANVSRRSLSSLPRPRTRADVADD